LVDEASVSQPSRVDEELMSNRPVEAVEIV
jgi:hypothetical protein